MKDESIIAIPAAFVSLLNPKNFAQLDRQRKYL
jgi:hypothetical protein